MGKGIFVFQMQSEEAKMNTMERGPWGFSRRPLIIREWEVGMPIDKPAVENLPIWVKFPKLPFELWTSNGLSMLSSTIGKPLYADRTTSMQTNLAYARVCVEITEASELHTEIPIKYKSGVTFKQQVKYEWVSDKCEKCRNFGHKIDGCKEKGEEGDISEGKGKEKVIVEVVSSSSVPCTPEAMPSMTRTLFTKPAGGKNKEEKTGGNKRQAETGREE